MFIKIKGYSWAPNFNNKFLYSFISFILNTIHITTVILVFDREVDSWTWEQSNLNSKLHLPVLSKLSATPQSSSAYSVDVYVAHVEASELLISWHDQTTLVFETASHNLFNWHNCCPPWCSTRQTFDSQVSGLLSLCVWCPKVWFLGGGSL